MRAFLEIKKLQAERSLREMMENLRSERGDTNFVSIILIMVIVIAIAGIFRTQLTSAVNQVFGKLLEFIG